MSTFWNKVLKSLLFLALLSQVALAGDVKLSALSDVGTPASGDKHVVLQGGVAKLETNTQAKTGMSLNNVENTAVSTWAGSTNLTTLGTVSTASIGDAAAASGADFMKRTLSATFINPVAGDEAYVQVPYDCTVGSWEVVADASGSIVIDVWDDTYANWPPTVADTIAGSELPTLSSAQKNTDTSLTTWSSSNQLTAGHYIIFHVNSASTVTKALVVLKVTIR